MARRKLQTVKVEDYGDADINRLAVVLKTFEAMTDEERHRMLVFLKSKYSKAWPSESY